MRTGNKGKSGIIDNRINRTLSDYYMAVVVIKAVLIN